MSKELFLFSLLSLFLPIFAFPSSKVVVIGGGIAGLTTAHRLRERGMDVELYEARGRVGGRIFSVQINDQIGELGAQNLFDGGEAENILRLIGELGLEVQKESILVDDDFFSYFNAGKLISIHKLFPPLDPEALHKKLALVKKESGSMFEVLSAFFEENDPIFKYLSVRLAGYEGAPIENLSSHYIETLYQMILGGTSYEIASLKGGNSLLPEKIGEILGDRLHLDAPLKAVSKTDGAYTLLFQDGREVSADILVLAIPCSVYADISFEEGVIAKERLEGIQSVQYGTNAKVLFPFEEKPERKMGLINDRIGAFFGGNGHLLTCYYTGESGRFSADTIQENFDQDRPMLQCGYAASFSEPSTYARDEPFARYKGPVGYSWPNDPYVKGSYSYIAPGQDALLTATCQVVGETVKTLFAPIDDTLYFAGEHATILQEIPGTMEAACESGERAARMIAKGLL